MTKKKVLLVITDGIGYDEGTTWNAFYHATKPTYEYLLANVPYSMISTFGESIGLPEGQMGNSEVGHMCIGAGKVLYQDLVRISMSINSGRLEKDKTLDRFSRNVGAVHLCGLVSDGGVHSHINHMLALAKILSDKGKKVYIHAITDGRDVQPLSAINFIKQIIESQNDNISLATISGRFYAMDRDNRWDRVKAAYECIVNGANKQNNPLQYIQSQYEREITDEFVQPASFNDFSGMHDNDGFLFVNFRSDRAREIVRAIGCNDFSEFDRENHPKIKTLTMCQYDKNFDFEVLFPKENVANPLAKIISDNNLKQAHIAETEKYAHVTFFFNGGIEEPFSKEERILIPSPKVKTYDLKPEMSAAEVCEATIKCMDSELDFIVVNFANGDMVGHTGDFEAAKKAVSAVDNALGKLIQKAKEKNYSVIITSDHGNCERMKDNNGNKLTNHTVGYVWCFVIDKDVSKVANGGLNNIAPSILKLLNIPQPNDMSGALF